MEKSLSYEDVEENECSTTERHWLCDFVQSVLSSE